MTNPNCDRVENAMLIAVCISIAVSIFLAIAVTRFFVNEAWRNELVGKNVAEYNHTTGEFKFIIEKKGAGK
jgi:hypothetical protein